MYHKPHVNDHGLILLRVVGDSVLRVHSLLHFHLWTFLYQLYTKGPRYLFLVGVFFLLYHSTEDKEQKEWPVTWSCRPQRTSESMPQ